jgi:phospho-N-acetylmuramoyl-pentapeptide-transferase
MLYYLAQLLSQDLSFLNVFKYITFRSGAAAFFALSLSIALGGPFIRWLRSIQNGGQPIRLDGPESHLISKVGTPTMGGVLIIVSMVASSLLFADLYNPYVWVILFVTLSYAVLGFMDDYLKVKYKNSKV